MSRFLTGLRRFDLHTPGGVWRVLLLAALLIVTASPVGSQERPVVIAAVLSRDVPPYREALRGFEIELKESGRPYRIHEFIADGLAAKRGTLIDKIRNREPDLLFTVGSAATQLVVEEVGELPIVFSMVLPTSGRRSLEAMREEHVNLAGVAMEIPVATQFAELKRILPGVRRIGVMFNPAISGSQIDEAGEAALALGLQLVPFAISDENDLVAWTGSMSKEIDVLWSVPDSTVFSTQGLKHVLLETLRHRVPFVGLSPSFVKAGALLAFSTEYRDLGGQAAQQSLEILDGRPAAEMPLAVPRRVKLSINMNTAKRIRVEFDEATLSEADVHF